MLRPVLRIALLAIVLAAPVAGCEATDRDPSPSPAPSATPIAPSASPPASPTSPSDDPGPTPRTVQVEGRDVAIDCQGSGVPTVILESGLGVPLQSWDAVIRGVAEHTRVCRYDRPTLESDDPAALPHTADRMVAQLRALLAAAGEEPPYVLVGQSLGGLNTQLYARLHPDDLVGMVLIDAVHPDLDRRIEELLTPDQVRQRRAELERNREGVTFEDIRASADAVLAAPGFPPVGTIVIRHGLPFESTDPTWPTDQVESLWTELQADLSGLGDPPRPPIVATNSHDRIQEEEPQVVVDAILELVEGVR